MRLAFVQISAYPGGVSALDAYGRVWDWADGEGDWVRLPSPEDDLAAANPLRGMSPEEQARHGMMSAALHEKDRAR